MESTEAQSAKRFRFGLRTRFVATISLVLILVFVTTAVVLLKNSRSTLTTALNRNSMVFATLATRPIGDAYNLYQSYGEARVKQEVLKQTSLNETIRNVTIVDTSGKTVYSLSGASIPVSASQGSSFNTQSSKNNQGAITTIVEPYLTADGQHPFDVAYAISTTQLEQNLRKSTETIIVFSVLGLLLTAAVTYYLVNRFFLKPLEALSRSSLAIASGSYDQQIISMRNDEIGDLSISVNTMATNLKQDIFKLKEVDEMKNEFIMITSHNLRTPLTIIEGYVEIIHDAELDEELRSMMSAIEDGLRRLASFSEDILTIASIESGKTSIARRPVTMAQLLKGIEQTYREATKQQGVELVWNVQDIPEKLSVSAIHIRGVLRNLLDNAVKFTPKGGKVGVDVTVENGSLIMTVKDTGIGITADEMPKLFTKFHRGTSTYKYNYEGTGIGLYATKLIVQAHGGIVTAASTPQKGSTFTVTIPDVLLAAPPKAIAQPSLEQSPASDQVEHQ